MDLKKPTRRRVGRAERERQILDAATAVFTERGYQAASMDAVAERVGVTKPVLYDHFGSKEGLLLASVARTRQELLTETTEAVAGASEPEDMVRRGFRAFFDFLDAKAYAWTLLYEGAMNPVGTAGEAVDSIRNQHIDLIVGMIRLQAPDADPRRLESYAHIIVGASERLALWRNQRGDVSAADATEYLMDMIWTGMGGKWRERGAQQ